jgi:dienelactone hydrolase
MACHGSQMLDHIHELDGLHRPVTLLWGDQDHAAPLDVLQAYRAAAARRGNVEVHVFAGVKHGYMFRGNADAYDRASYENSMEIALTQLARLRGTPAHIAA